MSILKACYCLFFCCLVVFFRRTIQAQPHFWPWHACLNQALHERSDPQSERADAYSLTRRNYQERLEPLILGINCRAENRVQKCSWRARLSMTGAFLFQTTARTLLFAFIILCIFLMLWLNTATLSALTAAAFLQELMGGSGWMQAIRRCAICDGRLGSGKWGFPCLSGVWLVTGSQRQTSKHSCVLCVSWCALCCEKQRGRELR